MFSVNTFIKIRFILFKFYGSRAPKKASNFFYFDFFGNTSSGKGNKMVEFFSAAILDKV